MSKAQQQETSLLEQLLLTTRMPATSKAYFLHYWPAFSAHFQAVTDYDPEYISKQYQIADAKLKTELKSKDNLLGDGTLWRKLLLLGHELLAADQALDVTAISRHPFLDSDLLLKLLPTPDDTLHRLFREIYAPAFWAINRKHVLKSGGAAGAMGGDEEQSLFASTVGTLMEKIRLKKLVAPMKSTVFTYAYRIYEYKAKDAQRKKGTDANYVDYVEPEIPPRSIQYWEELLSRFHSLKRYDFHDEKNFVYFLLSRVEEKCRNLLTRHYIDGAELASVALELDIPPNGIKSQAKRCRDSLESYVKSPNHG